MGQATINQVYTGMGLYSNLVEAWLCYHYIRIFLPDRIRGRLPSFLLSLFLVDSVRAIDHFGTNPLIFTLWLVFFICMTMVILFYVDLFYAVSLVSFYFLCMYIINYLYMSIMDVMTGNQEFARFILDQLFLWRCVYLAVDKAVLFLLYPMARKALHETLFYNPRMIFLVSLFGILGTGYLSIFTLKEMSALTLFNWRLCPVILPCLCLVMLFYANYIKEREMHSTLGFKDRLIQQEHGMMQQIQKEQEILSHNLKNHLLILDGMVRQDDTKNTGVYISRLRAPLDHLTSDVWTGMSTLNVLLNYTKGQTKRAGIRFTVQADALNLYPVEGQDICSLFSNLFDNAYEASARILHDRGWTLVRIRRMREMIFFGIPNSSPNVPCCKNGRLVSGKCDQILHGIGLGSASLYAQKYGGQLDHECVDCIFSMHVCPLGGIKTISSS